MPLPVGSGADEKAAVKLWLKDRNKFMTGFCGNGQHEGEKPTNFKGVPLPTCPIIFDCPCDCHYRIDQMFEMTGMARVEMKNPDYAPDKGHFLPPIREYEAPTTVAEDVGDTDTPPDTEQPSTAILARPTVPLAERRGPSGVSVKGGLEARVWLAVRTFQQGDELPATPPQIAEWMVEQYRIPTPSSGAIREVFIRWEKLSFAEWAKKPNRFVRFIGSGDWEELEELKAKAKRTKAMAESAARRGFR